MVNENPKRFNWSGEFTASMQGAYQADGFLIIDNFATHETCDKLMNQSDALIEGFDAEAHRVAFSATGQTHAASDYFKKSAIDISFFLEEEAVNETGNLLKKKTTRSK